MRIKVLVAAEVDQTFHERIGSDERYDVRFEPVYDPAALAKAVGDCQVLVTRYHNAVTRDVLEAAPRLRLIVQGTSGLDNIDEAAASKRRITIVGIPGQNANAVAELVIGHMIALTRTVRAYGEMMRAGEWSRGDCATRHEIRGYTLGIVGLGRVGTRVTRLARSFGVECQAYDPYLTDANFSERGATRIETLTELLECSDILTLHVPLTDETRGMIGGKALDRLPPRAFVVNTCRGPVLDLREALARLESGRIAGLALDVYDDEPPLGVRWPDHPGLILTPHIAGCTAESKASIGAVLYEKICEHSDGIA